MITKLISKLRPTKSTTLTTAGLGWLSTAAWQLHETAGIGAVGVSLILLAWLLED